MHDDEDDDGVEVITGIFLRNLTTREGYPTRAGPLEGTRPGAPHPRRVEGSPPRGASASRNQKSDGFNIGNQKSEIGWMFLTPGPPFVVHDFFHAE